MEDIARLRLEILGDEAEKTVESLNSGLKDVNSEIKLMELNGEKGSEAWRELKNVQREIKDELKDLNQNLDLNEMNWNQLNNRARQLRGELNNLTIGSEEWIAKLKQISEVDEKIGDTREEMKRLKGEGESQEGFWTSFKANFTAAFAWDMVKEAASAVFDFGMEVFNMTSKFEKYETVLKTSLGGQQEAIAAMEMIKDIAATTPVSVDEMTDSFIKFVNRGVQPTKDEIKNFADLAASQGKSFDQLTEAVLDAQTGEFERLKEFGIKAKTVGDDVELSFKGQTVSVEKNEEAIYKAIVAMGDYQGVAGMTSEMSATLEGRTSNLGDKFDFIMVALGEKLKPAFLAIIDVMDWVLDVTSRLIQESDPLVEVFKNIWELLGNLWDSYKSVWSSMTGGIEVSVTLRDVINDFSIALQGAFTMLRVGIAVLQGFYDGMNALINKGKEVANFFGADFKIDTSATFDKMTDNFESNMASIKNSWSKTMTDVHVNNLKDALDASIKTEDNKLKEAKKRIESEKLDEKQKLAQIQQLNTDHDKKVSDLKKESLKKQTVERLNEINKTAKTEEEREEKKQKLLTEFQNEYTGKRVDIYSKLTKTAEENHTKVSKAESDKRAKADKKEADDKAKANVDANKKIQDNQILLNKDILDRSIKNQELIYARELKRINDSKADEALKEKQRVQAFQLHTAALEKIDKDHKAKLKAEEDKKAATEEKARKDKETAQKKANDEALKGEKALFDAQFQAFTASKNLEFNLAKTTTAQKIELLRQEAQFHRDKLEMEAAHQKTKIATEIADETDRAARFKSIDEKLAADLKASDAKLQADKSKQLADAHKQRQDNTKQFFDALEGMAKGDFTSFMTFLNNKVKNEATANQQRLKDFANKGTETLAVAAQVVSVMQTLNETFTKKKLAQIEKEKDTQLKSWEAQYKSGKLSKEQYEAGVSKINKEAAQKEHEAKTKAWKRDQTMQIAMAIINGAMAALKSLATMGFPLGLIGVAASAVMTGIQIGIIKNQKPPEAPSFKSGGYVRNAGVPQGSRHGSQYGQSGIALWDRKTGQEIGEMEGGEPIMILSRSTYENNGDVIDKLLNSSLHRNGARIFQKGGIHGEGGSYINYLEPLQYGQMYLFGSKKRKAAAAAAEAEANASDMVGDTEGMDSDSAATTATSQAAIEASQKVQQEIADNTLKATEQLEQMLGMQSEANGLLVAIKDKPSGISLHDLNSALASNASVSSRSNL
ncbi:hypothetical protein [Emticicia aquatilis]|nr:hypothetical protein [Emticicia aquatilis]